MRTTGDYASSKFREHVARNILAKVPKNAQAEVQNGLLGDLRRGLPDRPMQLPQWNSTTRTETAVVSTDSTAIA